MTTPTLERPTTVPSPSHGETDDDDGFAHHFRHDDIERSLISGVPVRALCGYRKRITRPNQAGLPICPKCAELHELAESLES